MKGLEPGRFLFLAQAILWELGDRRNAFGIVVKAAEARPSVPTLLRKAVVLAEMGNRTESEGVFLQAQDLITDPNPFLAAWINTQRGRYRLAEGKAQEARAFFVAALERFPALAQAQEGLALAFEVEGNTKEAEARLRRLVTRNPDDLRAQLSLFLLQRKNGTASTKTLQALSDRFVNATTSPELAGLLAAEFFIEIGQFERAEKLIEAELARSAAALELVKKSAALKAAGIVPGDGPGNPRALVLRDTLRAKRQQP
jgi:tetratricopeptide (TPR) repeat protein